MLSLSEAGALAFKATRGAGMDWGLAEEAQWAVTWVHNRGLPGLPALLEVLEAARRPFAVEEKPDTPGAMVSLSVLHAGAALSDHGRVPPEGVHLGAVSGPLLIVPFVAHLEGCYAVRWRGARAGAQVTVLGDDIWCVGATHTTDIAQVSITPLPEAPISRPSAVVRRAMIDEDCLTRLEAFAQATYAPATQASRERGAGGADT